MHIPGHLSLSLAVVVALGGFTLVAGTAEAGRYCTGSCDSYVDRASVPPPPPRYAHHDVRVHGHVVRKRRVHRERRRARHLKPTGPIHMPGRTRFCSDHVEWHGHLGIRRCVHVRNDLLGHH